MLLIASPAWSATYYIDSAATGAGDGTSWTDAYTTIQAALNARNTAGHTFYVSGGASGKTYAETITLQANTTTLAGSQEAGHSGQVRIDASGAATHVITTNGKTNCTINYVELYGATGTNYGIVDTGGGTTLNSVKLTSNGRGIYSNKTTTLNRCLITATGSYAVYTQNTAGSSITLNYCIITQTTGAVVMGYFYTTTLNNCVIYTNGAKPVEMTLANSQTVTIKNSIIYRADSGDLISRSTHPAPYPVSDYNVWYGGSATPFNDNGTAKNFATWQTDSSQDAHSYNSDPKFVAAGTDFHVLSGGPGINRGTDLSLTSDYEGSPVPKNGTQDIGAYEKSLGGLMQVFNTMNQFSFGRRLH